MSFGVCPVEQGHWTHLYADAVANADFPINRHIRAVNPLFCGRFYWSPNLVPVVFACNLSFVLKIRIYGQNIHQREPMVKRNIRLSYNAT